MHLDAALERLASVPIREHDDGARRVTEREVGDASRRTARVHLTLGEHDEVEHRCAGDRAPQFERMRALHTAEPRELAFESRDAALARAPERRVDDYAFRHFRPSRSMRSSASFGPHVPAS